MVMDNRGQISLEYLLIFAVSLIILIAFTLPLVETALENTLDVSDSLNAKNELSKLSNAIGQVYAEGQGSKQTIYLSLNKAMNVKISNSYLSGSHDMHDGNMKEIRLNYHSNLNSGSMFLDKGENKLIVEWPVGEDKMVVYKKL